MPKVGLSLYVCDTFRRQSPADAWRGPIERTIPVTRAIDCLVNVDLGDATPPDWMVRVKEDYFKAGDEMLASTPADALIEEMDANGVARAVLLTRLAEPSPRALAYVEAFPGRFALGIGGLDLLHPKIGRAHV